MQPDQDTSRWSDGTDKASNMDRSLCLREIEDELVHDLGVDFFSQRYHREG